MKRIIALLAFLTLVVVCYAQNDTAVNVIKEPTGMRANGKIWVVMAVCVTILLGLVAYVVRLDRKISRLEK